ncbi:hypothetical protein GGS21DRAFT_491344 [Xylaria nigripes]|nr:hypothetical protein GGS21DRAFT_491344 [Xylaria nigripes]
MAEFEGDFMATSFSIFQPYDRTSSPSIHSSDPTYMHFARYIKFRDMSNTHSHFIIGSHSYFGIKHLGVSSTSTGVRTTSATFAAGPSSLDEIATEDPERVLYSIEKTDRMQDGFQDINSNTVANALLQRRDILLEAHISLLKRTACSALLFPTEPPPIVHNMLEACLMENITTSDLHYFLDEQPVEVIPLQKTFEELRDETFCILHTSGSTGIAKPVAVTYGSYGGMDS